MPAVELCALTEAAGGRLLRGDPRTVVSTFGIDTRRLVPGGAFFAIEGSRTDGHRYLAQAAGAGAAVAVIEKEPDPTGDALPALILVDSTVAALGRLGSWVRRLRRDVKWICLTGSNGKTTTKEMIAEGLSAGHRVHRTPGNYNNHLGVPLSALALPDDAEIAVLELAMNHAGEIAELARMIDPDVGLVTNIRAVHMESFEALDDVAAAKGELFALMRDDAVAVVNLDDLHVRVQAARHVGPRVTFGQSPEADLRLEQIENRFLPGATLVFRYQGQSFRLQLRIGGAHSAQNALASLATIIAAGGDPLAASERIEQIEAGPGRGRIHELGRGMLLVDDTYNCSPPALASILETMRLSEPPGRRVLILGDMLELGPMKAALHREAGRRAGAAGIRLLVTVGPLSREAAETARRAGVSEVHHFPDSASAEKPIVELLRDGDLIVVKGSRAMQMERIVHALSAAFREVG